MEELESSKLTPERMLGTAEGVEYGELPGGLYALSFVLMA